jgi:hypothetical protein
MLSLFARLTYYQIVFETQTHASEPPMFQPVQSRIVMRKHQRLRRGIIVSRPFQFPDQNIEFGSETEVRELHFSLLSCRGYVFVNIFILVCALHPEEYDPPSKPLSLGSVFETTLDIEKRADANDSI